MIREAVQKERKKTGEKNSSGKGNSPILQPPKGEKRGEAGARWEKPDSCGLEKKKNTQANEGEGRRMTEVKV